MKYFFLALIVLGAVFGIGVLVAQHGPAVVPPADQTPPPPPAPGFTLGSEATVVASGLEIPWDLAFLPDGAMLVTERPGRLLKIDQTGMTTPIALSSVRATGEGGLLGLTLHPRFTENHWLYLYLTAPGTNGHTENRVERYQLTDTTLSDKIIIIDGIPGALYHDGGRIEFGPDGLLYITTGDATEEDLAQKLDSLAGKILRLNDDGSIPAGNPFGTAVYSYGHRNPQGLTWDGQGRLWSTEHGRSGVLSGFDELNLIEPGGNYGWPTTQGDETAVGLIAPVLQSGSDVTWAPASALYLDGRVFFAGLRGETLYEAVLEGKQVKELREHFVGEFGRLRTVRQGPDGALYLTTSNRDDRGEPEAGDDKIIRIK